MMWQPYIRDNGEWYAAKILQGFFGAPIESLAEITISDVVSLDFHSVVVGYWVIGSKICSLVLHPRERKIYCSICPRTGIQQWYCSLDNWFHQRWPVLPLGFCKSQKVMKQTCLVAF